MPIKSGRDGQTRTNGGQALSGLESDPEMPETTLYQGHRYVLRHAPDGWWAIVLTLDIETMFCRDAAAAAVAAETVIDGFLRAEQGASRRH